MKKTIIGAFAVSAAVTAFYFDGGQRFSNPTERFSLGNLEIMQAAATEFTCDGTTSNTCSISNGTVTVSGYGQISY